jgi:hypothetical protein
MDGRETIISIVEAGRKICASLASGTPLPELSAPTERVEARRMSGADSQRQPHEFVTSELYMNFCQSS